MSTYPSWGIHLIIVLICPVFIRNTLKEPPNKLREETIKGKMKKTEKLKLGYSLKL